MGSLEDAASNIIEKQKQAEREKIESEQRKQRLENDPTLEDNYRAKIDAVTTQWLREYVIFMCQYSIAPIPCVTTRLGERRTYWFRETEQVIHLVPIGFSAWPLAPTEFAVSEYGWLIKAALWSTERFSQEMIFCLNAYNHLHDWIPTPPDYESSGYEYKRKLAWEFPEGWPMQPLLLLSRFPRQIAEPYFSNESDRSTIEGDICLSWTRESSGYGDDKTSWNVYHFLHKILVNSMVQVKQARDSR